MLTATIAVGQTKSTVLRVPSGAKFTKVYVQNITPGNLFVEVSLDGITFYNLQVLVPTASAATIGTVNFNAATANFVITFDDYVLQNLNFIRFGSSVSQTGSPATISVV